MTSRDFSEFIRKKGINEFYIIGADATACVKSTCFNIAKAGYTVHVISDCVTSYDLKKMDKMLEYYADKGCEVRTLAEYQRGEDLNAFNKEYLTYTDEAAENCTDRDLSADSMVIGTSAIVDTEIDGAVNMYSGFNNPFLVWGKYRKKFFRYYLPVSFQFHHTQMDGAHAGRFLENLQKEMNDLRDQL